MKMNKFLAGIFGILLIFGLSLVSCDNSNDKDENEGTSNPFAGTWTASETLSGIVYTYTLTITDSTWTLEVKNGNTIMIGSAQSGTYTHNGNSAVVRGYKNRAGNTPDANVTISGNSFTIDGITFTKH